MPIKRVCAVRDSAAEVFGQPIFVPSTASAIRAFTDHVNSKDDTEIVRHPKDFALFHIADWDDETGVFECLPHPKQLVRGEDVKQPANKE